MAPKEHGHKHKHTIDAEGFLLKQLDAKDSKDLPDSCNNTHKLIDARTLAKELDHINAAAEKLAAVRADANSSDDDKKSALKHFVKEAKKVDDILSDINEDSVNNPFTDSIKNFKLAIATQIAAGETNPLPDDFDASLVAFKAIVAQADAETDYLLDVKVIDKLEDAIEAADISVDKVIAARALQSNEAPTQEQLLVLYTKASDDLNKLVNVVTEISTHFSDANPFKINVLEHIKADPTQVLSDFAAARAGSVPSNFDNHLDALDTHLDTHHERSASYLHNISFGHLVGECIQDLSNALFADNQA